MILRREPDVQELSQEAELGTTRRSEPAGSAELTREPEPDFASFRNSSHDVHRYPLGAVLIAGLVGYAIGFLVHASWGSTGRQIDRLRNQLPPELRERLTISILPGKPDELPTACYGDGDQDFSIQVRKNGLISESALAHLCSMFA